jgi:hypothetical protein
MSVPNTFNLATGSIPLSQLDANFAYYDAAFQISGTAMAVNYTLRLKDVIDNTKVAEFLVSGITTATTRQYTLPNVTGSLATTANLTQTFSGTTTFSAASLTFGSSTAASTYNLGSGATIAGATKTINIGTGGVSTSITNINIGSSVAGATGKTTINSEWTEVNAFAAQPPITVNAATYTVLSTDYSLIFTTTASTVTLPTAATYTGRVLMVKNITATAIISASSNVVPLGSATAGTAILAATAGKFAMLQSDGTNWITMMAN